MGMDQWVDDREAARILGFRNVQTLRNWRHLMKGPPYSKLVVLFGIEFPIWSAMPSQKKSR